MSSTLETALTQGRLYAEALMTDTCTVSYRTGSAAQNETTGREVPQMTVRFTTKCKVQDVSYQGDSIARASRGGEREIITMPRTVHIPVNTPPVAVDDIVEITAISPVTDPQLLGIKFRVYATAVKSSATARRIPVEQVLA